jgi:AraC family transcriptional activator of pobA
MKNATNDSRNFCDDTKHPSLPTTDHLEGEEFEISNIKLLHPKLPQKTPVWFTTNCFSLTLVINASGRFTTKKNGLDIGSHTFFFSRPDSYRELEWYTLHEIYHLTFSERFLSKYAGVELFKTFPFLLLESVQQKHSNPQIFEDLKTIYMQIEKIQLGNSPFKKNIIANLLTRLLLRIKSNFWDNYDIGFNKNKEDYIVEEFIMNLEQHYQQLQQGKTSIMYRVNDYAKMQGIHENYLYTVIKERTGKIISHWIAEKTILVAKGMLENPSFSIKEISYRLGFPYFSYFSIFFKKHTGLTPKDFRKSSMVQLYLLALQVTLEMTIVSF